MYSDFDYFLKKALCYPKIRLRVLTNGKLLNIKLPYYYFDKKIKWGITFDGFFNGQISGVQKNIDIDNIKKNIEELCKAYGGDFCYLNYTVYANNLDGIIPFLKFGINCGIQEMYLTKLKIYEGFEEELSELCVQETEETKRIVLEAKELLKSNNIDNRGMDFFEKRKKKMCYLNHNNSFIIDVDGSIAFCSGKEDAIFASIFDDDLERKYNDYIELIKENNFCSQCHFNALPNGLFNLPKTIKKGD